MPKQIVVIGGGPSGVHSAQKFMKMKDVNVTLVQANNFVEWPLAMAVCIVKPETHDKALAPNPAKFQLPNVAYKYGVVDSVDTAGKKVIFVGGESVPYDVLIVATGFKMPLLYPKLGVSVDARKEEVVRVAKAIKDAKTVVISGGGPCAIEVAGNIRISHPAVKITMLCRGGVVSQFPEATRKKVEAQLQKVNIEVSGGAFDAPLEYSLEPGTIKWGEKDVPYDIYLPIFAQGPNTTFLEGAAGVLDGKKRIEVNEFLQSKVCPEIFAVGVSNVPEPFIGMAKLNGQWDTVGKNVVAMLGGKQLSKHKENMPSMTRPVMLTIGHGSKGWSAYDCSLVPAPAKCCCCCGYGGFPCCPPCWPCMACAGCGACPCGYCCCPPEGSGPAQFIGTMAFKMFSMHYKGTGEAPPQQTMGN